MAAARKSVYQRFADGRIKKISGDVQLVFGFAMAEEAEKDEVLARLVTVIETVWPDVRARLRNIAAQQSLQLAEPAAVGGQVKAKA